MTQRAGPIVPCMSSLHAGSGERVETRILSNFHVVIPARIGSSRLPRKPLLDIAGLPMIVRVARCAAASGARGVVVATDDVEIQRIVEAAGHRAMLTRADHESGSDRVAEVAAREGWSDEALVINVQGDEPLLPPQVVRQLADAMAVDSAVDVATLCETISDPDMAANPNNVKVVRDARNRALYFSRTAIPSFRADGRKGPSGPWLRHIGIYGYRVRALRRFVALPPSALETAERLEQLRLLENGLRLLVLDAAAAVPKGVDTPEDLERVRRLLGTPQAR